MRVGDGRKEGGEAGGGACGKEDAEAGGGSDLEKLLAGTAFVRSRAGGVGIEPGGRQVGHAKQRRSQLGKGQDRGGQLGAKRLVGGGRELRRQEQALMGHDRAAAQGRTGDDQKSENGLEPAGIGGVTRAVFDGIVLDALDGRDADRRWRAAGDRLDG